MARNQKRDARGRFTSGGGTSRPAAPKATRTPKTTSARGRAQSNERRAKAALKAMPTRKVQQAAATAARARAFYKATGTGTKRSPTRARMGPRNGIRRTGGLPRPQASNGIRPVVASGASKRGKRPAAVSRIVPSPRVAKPGSLKGEISRMRRVTSGITTKWARRTARDMADATGKGAKAKVARMTLSVAPQKELKAARGVIAGRAARAAAAAARGSKSAAKAQAIYDRQLAPVLPKGKGKGKNNLRPGPSNTKGTPKKKRKPRKK